MLRIDCDRRLVIVVIGKDVVILGHLLAYLILVERTVEGCEEEHDNLCSHSEAQHDICTRIVKQFEERTQNYD